ncbi:MAG: ABC transporter permease [Bacteroidota bacterium]
MSKSNLPSSVESFLRFFCREDLIDTVLGDLEELYLRRTKQYNQQRAYRLLLLDALLFFRPFAFKKNIILYNTSPMLANNIKVSFRKICKHQFSTLTRLLSLIIGMVSVFFIALYLHHELTYDHFHLKRDHIFQLNTTIQSPTGDLSLALSATALADYVHSISPDVEATVRINKAYGSRVIKQGENQFIEQENMFFADPRFFDVFDFEVLEGDLNVALNEPFEVVLTEQAATKYFGKKEIIGKTLLIDKNPFKVSGVIRDMPSNSHFQFNFLMSMESFLESRPNAHENWTWLPMNTFLLLKENTDIKNLTALLQEVPAYQKVNSNTVEQYVLNLEAFNNIHFSNVPKGQLGVPGNINNLYILIGIGIIILLLACSNYINLTTATISLYENEISFRKTIGASGSNIFSQFMVESGIVVGLSSLFSLILVIVLLPKFESIINIPFTWQYFLQSSILLILVAIPMILALIGGVYPAQKFSSISINKIIDKPNLKKFGDTRSFLLTFQFCMTSALIIGSIIIYTQLDYLRNQDLGFDLSRQIIINGGPNAQLNEQKEAITDEFKQIPSVQGVTFSSHVPGEEPNGVTTVFKDDAGNERTGEINLTLVDPDFIPQYGLDIIAGRNFREGQADITSTLIVNEACAKAYGFNNPEEILGQDFTQWGGDGRVIGVVKDFNYLSLHQDIGSLSLKIWPTQFQKITLNIAYESFSETLALLETKWKAFFPNIPFNYYSLDENFNKQYEADERFMTIVNTFTAVAIIIGLLGLIAFTAFWCGRKRRELSIRKVLGATPRGLVWKLYLQFVTPVLIGFLLSAPLAFYLGQIWINQFAYRYEPNLLIFIFPLILILGLATFVIGSQIIRVVNTNPVKFLKEQ